MAEDENEIVERFREGDTSAFETLLGRYEGLLRERVERRLPRHFRRRVSVADILQETRIAAFENRDKFEYRGEGSWLAWLGALAEVRVRRNVAHHGGVARRAVGREVSQGVRPETGQFAGKEPTPSEHAVASELEALAREALEFLDPEEREILRLCREEHLSMAECAVRMNRSQQSVRRLYGRALLRYRRNVDFLRGEEAGEDGHTGTP